MLSHWGSAYFLATNTVEGTAGRSARRQHARTGSGKNIPGIKFNYLNTLKLCDIVSQRQAQRPLHRPPPEPPDFQGSAEALGWAIFVILGFDLIYTLIDPRIRLAK